MNRPVPSSVWTIIDSEGMQVAPTTSFFASKKNADAKLRAMLRSYVAYFERIEEYLAKPIEDQKRYDWLKSEMPTFRRQLEERNSWRVVECEVVVKV